LKPVSSRTDLSLHYHFQWITPADLQDCSGIPFEAAGVDVANRIAQHGPRFCLIILNHIFY
jgi:hypothetical protein